MRTMTPGFHAVLANHRIAMEAPRPQAKELRKQLADARESYVHARLCFDAAVSDPDRNWWARRMGQTWGRMKRLEYQLGEA